MEDQIDGQPAVAAPEGEVQQTVTSDAGGEVGSVDWQKRYSDSSREAKRLFEEKTKFEAENKVLREQLQGSSLKKENNEARSFEMPPRDQVVKNLMESKGLSQEQADLWYDRDTAVFARMENQEKQIQALANLLRFQRDQTEKNVYATDTLAQKANEYFKGVPELEALPAAEKRERYKLLMERKTEIQGRDTTAAKIQAGGSVGGAGASRASNSVFADDSLAKSLGMPSAKALEEFSSVKTEIDLRNWKKKFNVKDL